MTMEVKSAVRAALAAWLQAFNDKDQAAFFALYDPDVTYANAGAPLRRGVDEMRLAFKDALNDPSIQLRFNEETVFASAEMALIAGNYHFGAVQQDGTLAPGTSGRVALLYRKTADGRWLLAYDIDNAAPDAPSLR